MDVRFSAATPIVIALRLLLLFASGFKLEVTISDVATAFFNANISADAKYVVEVFPEVDAGNSVLVEQTSSGWFAGSSIFIDKQHVVRIMHTIRLVRLLSDSAVVAKFKNLFVLVHVDVRTLAEQTWKGFLISIIWELVLHVIQHEKNQHFVLQVRLQRESRR